MTGTLAEQVHELVIVGAGMSGLLAARRWREAGREAVVLDKGRGVGGRMATRRLGTGRADHGAQFFTARADRFVTLVHGWLADGCAVEWCREVPGVRVQDESPPIRYRGAMGMSSVPKHLAEGLDVHTSTRIERIDATETGWLLTAESGWRVRGHRLMLTAPVPQSLALLEAGHVMLDADVREALLQIRYEPCLAVMVVLDGPSAVPEPGAERPEAGPIAWITDNRMKGISPDRTIVTIHADAEFSRTHFRGDREAAARELIEAAARWLPSPVIEFQVHGWLYSKPTHLHHEPCLMDTGSLPLVFAGDAFAEPRVEGAALSGLAAAEALLKT